MLHHQDRILATSALLSVSLELYKQSDGRDRIIQLENFSQRAFPEIVQSLQASEKLLASIYHRIRK